MPSSSDMPRRLPESAITLGTPALAAFSILSRNCSSSLAWFSLRFQPSAIDPPPGTMAGTRPYFCTTGQSAGSIRSMPLRPMRAASLARSSTEYLL